ncbi:MAG: hypothetical protein AAFP03_07765 [Cyanobacteria bacterium J06598_3]
MSYSKADFVDRLNDVSAGFSVRGHQLVRYFPFLFIGLLISLKSVSRHQYWQIMAVEDGPAEYLTSVAYIVASVVCIAIFTRLKKKTWSAPSAIAISLMAALFFVVAMEEISWGQRIFSVQSPEFFQTYNGQAEITLHNFLSRYPLHMLFILAGLYGGFAWKVFPTWFKVRFPKLSQFLIPNRLLRWYFLPTALLYIYYDYVSVFLINVLGLEILQWQGRSYSWIIGKDQEPIELLMSIGVMFFAIALFNRQTHGKLME